MDYTWNCCPLPLTSPHVPSRRHRCCAAQCGAWRHNRQHRMATHTVDFDTGVRKPPPGVQDCSGVHCLSMVHIKLHLAIILMVHANYKGVPLCQSFLSLSYWFIIFHCNMSIVQLCTVLHGFLETSYVKLIPIVFSKDPHVVLNIISIYLFRV